MLKHFRVFRLALLCGLLAIPISAIKADNHAIETIQQTSVLKGTVKDDMGPVTGASVIIDGSSLGTITDLDGKFSLSNVNKGDVITISFIGYQTKKITYNGESVLNITLKDDTQLLDEVVVVGYGTQKKVNVTGAVGVVDAKELESRPVNSVGQALQGVVPGLNMSVNSSGGMINNNMSINIRGTGSIGEGSSSAPLVLIDGVEGNMNTLAPQDIENISVLKDASSAAIYGARAAFGVILITTKSGKSERTHVSYSNSVRFSKPISLPKMMDSRRFAQYWNRAAENNGQSHVFSEEVLGLIEKTMNNSWTDAELEQGLQSGTRPSLDGKSWQFYGGGHANTNWFKEHYRSSAPSHEHNISVSGGSEKVTYALSGTILDVTGLIKHGGDDLQRYNLNGKINVKVNDRVDVNFSTRWIREKYDRPSYLTGLFFHNIARRWPTVAVKDQNGYYTDHQKLFN